MRSIAMFGALAVFAAAPAAAQGRFRTPATNDGRVLGTIIGRDTSSRERTSEQRKSDHIPPGQRPPAGMCRIWIDGVPPGQQPAPTDCQTAVATKPANARVIWGDQTAFPGQAKGKFNKGKGKDRDRDHDEDDDRDDDGNAGGNGTHGKSHGKHGRKG